MSGENRRGGRRKDKKRKLIRAQEAPPTHTQAHTHTPTLLTAHQGKARRWHAMRSIPQLRNRESEKNKERGKRRAPFLLSSHFLRVNSVEKKKKHASLRRDAKIEKTYNTRAHKQGRDTHISTHDIRQDGTPHVRQPKKQNNERRSGEPNCANTW